MHIHTDMYIFTTTQTQSQVQEKFIKVEVESGGRSPFLSLDNIRMHSTCVVAKIEAT